MSNETESTDEGRPTTGSGGYVYPGEFEERDYDSAFVSSRGITRRDQLADQIMVALIVRGEFDGKDVFFRCPSCGWRTLVILEGECTRCHEKVDQEIYEKFLEEPRFLCNISYALADEQIAKGKLK